jgi:hypothetical protein
MDASSEWRPRVAKYMEHRQVVINRSRCHLPTGYIIASGPRALAARAPAEPESAGVPDRAPGLVHGGTSLSPSTSSHCRTDVCSPDAHIGCPPAATERLGRAPRRADGGRRAGGHPSWRRAALGESDGHQRLGRGHGARAGRDGRGGLAHGAEHRAAADGDRAKHRFVRSLHTSPPTYSCPLPSRSWANEALTVFFFSPSGCRWLQIRRRRRARG